MILSVGKFSEKEAMALCQWRYEPPYDIYNCPDWSTVKAARWGMADDKKRSAEFYSVYYNKSFSGFIRLVKNEDGVMLGLGLHPNLCGQGLGAECMTLALDAARARYGGVAIRLEVRKWNVRAVKCYTRAGFIVTDEYISTTPTGADAFVRMEYRG